MVKFLKIILATKFILLGSYLLGVRFGEKPASGTETPPSAPVLPSDSTPTAQSQEDQGPFFFKKHQSKTLLDDLLNIPNPDSTKITKEEVSRYLQIAERTKEQAISRVKNLQKQEESLKNLIKELDEKWKKLDNEKQFFLGTLQKEKELSQERLSKLAILYSKMDPKKAAPVFETMDKDLVVGLWKLLKETQVTQILSFMSPEKAKMLTEYFGRVGSAREYELLKEMNESLRESFDLCKKSL